MAARQPSPGGKAILPAVAEYESDTGPTAEYELAWRYGMDWLSALTRQVPSSGGQIDVLLFDASTPCDLDALCAQALEYAGCTAEALEQYRFARVVFPDVAWLGGLEAACLARNGKQAEARKILQELERRRKTEYVDARNSSHL